MFTGLIEATGEVAEVEPTPDGYRIRLTTAIAGELSPGDSLAVNGVCLTVVAAGAGRYSRGHFPRNGAGECAGRACARVPW